MKTPSPILNLLRVAALSLSLGMLVWFVYRASGVRSAVAAEPENVTSSGSNGATVTNSSALEVNAPSIAVSSKSIGQPIFSLRGSNEFINYGAAITSTISPSSKFGVVFQANEKGTLQPNASTNAAPAGQTTLAPATEPVSKKAEPAATENRNPTLAPGSKSFLINETTFFEKATPTPAPNSSPAAP